MNGVSEISGFPAASAAAPRKKSETQNNFKETLNYALKDVNDLIQDAGDHVEKMAKGEMNDLHQVMVAVEKASLGLEMVVEIRNKLLESYREFMRMQI